MVHHQSEDVNVVADPEQRRADRDLSGHVEASRTEFQCARGEFVLRDRDRIEPEGDLRGVEHLLVGAGVGIREHRPQRLVALDHVAHRGTQRVDVEFSGQTDGERNVVVPRGRVVAVEEPHALLRERQRNVRGPLHRREREPARPGGRPFGA
ncbi:hypothetical protein GCM10009855_08350 [Gordonia cholesterolivorans]|uniref:Uncharacterized protein n=1 Tax=Gordonia cholesterolivorans TaxID=559625 RepID=A0ABN3H7E5_9ACTN